MKRIIPVYAVAFVLSAMLAGCRSHKKTEIEYAAASNTVDVAIDTLVAKSTAELEMLSDRTVVDIVFTHPDTSGRVHVSRIRKTEHRRGNRSVSTAEFAETKTELSDNSSEYALSQSRNSERNTFPKPMFWLTAAFAISLTLILILNKKS